MTFPSGGEGNDVPDLDGNYISSDEVEHAFAVGHAVRVDVTFVGAGAVNAASGFDLHAEDLAAVDDCDVVGGRVSPGAEDGESVLGGAGHEKELGPFSLLLEVVDDVGGFVWHGVPWVTCWFPPCRKKRDKGGATSEL